MIIALIGAVTKSPTCNGELRVTGSDVTNPVTELFVVTFDDNVVIVDLRHRHVAPVNIKMTSAAGH